MVAHQVDIPELNVTSLNISLKKQQFVITHQHIILEETEKSYLFLSRPTLKHGLFLQKYKDNQLFCWHNTLTEGVSNPTV
jgi:hypothetical protein